jgi:hypothetical protein
MHPSWYRPSNTAMFAVFMVASFQLTWTINLCGVALRQTNVRDPAAIGQPPEAAQRGTTTYDDGLCTVLG